MDDGWISGGGATNGKPLPSKTQPYQDDQGTTLLLEHITVSIGYLPSRWTEVGLALFTAIVRRKRRLIHEKCTICEAFFVRQALL